MSKMDDMRAMREARFGTTPPRAAASAATPTASPKKTTRQAPPRPAAADSSTSTGEPSVRRCGHRAISGRTCTREHGHEAKSHRYA